MTGDLARIQVELDFALIENALIIFTAPLASRLYEQRFGTRSRTRQVVAGFGGA